MKNIVFAGCLILVLLISITGSSQSYANLEFIENKGQWDRSVKFKGDMTTGAFFLRSDGFTVVQHNTDDLIRLAEITHGHSDAGGVQLIQKNGKAASLHSSPASSPGMETTLRSHAYEVKFLNASNANIIADKPASGYNNYFIGNDPSKWASECKIYQAVTYQNMYPGIDARYYTDNGRLKYDIIVKPGADVNQVLMQYTGTDGLSVKNEELVIKTSVGDMKELAPYAYQVENGLKKEVSCRYKISGKVVKFSVDGYSRNSTLVIDPNLVFASFSGSTADNWGYTATYGPDGSFYGGGIVFGTGFPVSTGAFQTSFGGGGNEGSIGSYDIGLIKLTPNGQNRVYATYIGGNGNEQPHSLVVDNQGNLVMSGRSFSGNYPNLSGSFGPNGGWDIVVTKFNSNGTALIGSRKIGGRGDDGVNILPKHQGSGAISIRRNYGDDARSEVILDGSNNIYLASCTKSADPASSNDFPTTPGVFQPASGGANNSRRQDGVVLKMSPDLSNVLFSTYLGGDNDDAAFVLALNPLNNNIYVGGSTASNNFPGAAGGGGIHPTFQGGVCDGFVSIISNNGSTLIKSTYIGSNGDDMLYGIQFDQLGFPYVMGTTTGTIPVFNAAFNSQASGKQFISKLQPDLSAYVYSTNFGTNSLSPNLSPVAFLVDRCENVYVSGWGGSIENASSSPYPNSGTSGLSVTPDAIQATTDGSDFYFFVLEKNATSQLYGSFFGQRGGATGEHVDGGTSRFDKQGVIYQAICANCGGGATFPTTPGVWRRNNGSVNCNLALLKIAFNLAGVAASIRASINGVPRDTTGCVPLTVDFTDTIATGKSFIWNFGDGSADVRTTVPSISHTFNNVGNYLVRLISIDSSTCNISDTAYTTIKARNDQAFLGFNAAKLPPCQSTTYQFTNTSVAPPGKPFSNTAFRWTFGDNTPSVITGPQTINHAYAGNGTYTVTLELLDTTYCNAPETLTKEVRISPNVKASFETPPGGCAPYTAVFKNTSLGGQQFTWNFGDGTSSNETEPQHDYPTPGVYTITLEAIDSATCNIFDTTSFTITVSDKPVASFSYTPVPPRENTPVTFLNNSIGATSYRWEFGDGDTLLTTSTLPVSHIFNETATYNTCLIAINQSGCRDTACQEIKAKVIPLLDVPNAFTPNGDGVNDKIFVRGFGIVKMNWRIYNRWGTMVFQTNNRNEGWNGAYKGIYQPKEVYNYVLDVEFTDGTKYQKKGDITLL